MAYGGRTYTIQDIDGVAVSGVTVSVFDAGKDDLSTIYSDSGGVTSITNPDTSDGSGVSEFYAVAGFYDIRLFKAGYKEQWLRSVQIIDDALDAETLTIYATDSTTAGDIIRSALRKLRVYKPGEAILDAEVSDNLEVLNAMLDYWSSENLMIFAYLKEAFSLTTSQSLYTIGPGGDFSTTRPDGVEAKSSFIRDSSSNDYPLESMTQQEYNSTSLKIGSGLNNIPAKLWYDPQYPFGRIQFDCPASASLTLHLVSRKPFAEFDGITTQISFPHGYRLMLIYNLAVFLSSEYGKGKLTSEIAAIAASTKSHLKHKNARPIMADLSTVPGGGGGVYLDTKTGNFR